jgi:hypothetical protein
VSGSGALAGNPDWLPSGLSIVKFVINTLLGNVQNKSLHNYSLDKMESTAKRDALIVVSNLRLVVTSDGRTGRGGMHSIAHARDPSVR